VWEKKTSHCTMAFLAHGKSIIPGTSVAAVLWGRVSRWFHWRRKLDRDERVLQTFPHYLLTDMGLERLDIPGGTSGGRHSKIISHRHF
jgi:hypothetical protein